ncbi:MAG: hypothetical protein KJ648_07185 [Candidatus Omnitrophica bacterium]|nr:hypothetical protein [Candidatus Omnitrophota bacterium]
MNIGTASKRCKGLGKRDRKVCMKKAMTKGLKPKHRKSGKRSKRRSSKGGSSMLPLLIIAGAAGIALYSTKA